MGRLRRLAGEAQTVNAFALIATTAVTSGFGLLFWAVAARRYDTAIVGRTTSLIAAATVVTVIGQLNLAGVLSRFLPNAAEKSRRFVFWCYVSSIGLTLVLAAGFLATNLGHAYLRGKTTFELLFMLAALLLLLSSLQDSVLISLRRSPVVLGENLVIVIARLVLVVVFAPILPATGVITASLLPSLVAAPLVALYIFRRRIPEHEAASEVPSMLPRFRRLLYFVGASASRSIVSAGTTLCLPLVVTATLGVRATAYFAVPWLINTSIGLFLGNVAISYIVQARFERKASTSTLRRALVIGGWVIGISTLAETFAAPYVLYVLGSRFAHQGTTLMRLLGIATPFSGSAAIYTTFNSLDQRVWRLVLLEIAYSILLLGLAPTLLRHYGVSGVGWAYLIAEGVFGIGSVVPARRYLRNHQKLVADETNADAAGLLTT
jgi:O-antigen/teichoic acid export membrane protein